MCDLSVTVVTFMPRRLGNEPGGLEGLIVSAKDAVPRDLAVAHGDDPRTGRISLDLAGLASNRTVAEDDHLITARGDLPGYGTDLIPNLGSFL